MQFMSLREMRAAAIWLSPTVVVCIVRAIHQPQARPYRNSQQAAASDTAVKGVDHDLFESLTA